MATHARKSKGFTLVELLVVITIIGMLMALLLPAVQTARETARRMNCQSNLKNLHLATDNFEQAQGQYPGYQNTVGTARRKASWVVTLLPYLEQRAAFDTWTDPAQAPLFPYVELLNCPSDSAELDLPSLSYVANAGWGGTVDGDGNHRFADSIYDGVFVDRFDDLDTSPTGNTNPRPNPYDDRKPNLKKSTVDAGDGTNYTLLFSENLHETRKPSSLGLPANTWVAIEPPHGDTSLAVVSQDFAPKRYTVFLWFSPDPGQSAPLPPQENPPLPVHGINGDLYNAFVDNTTHAAARPASFHPGGVNVVFAGGNTHFLSETVSYRVYQQLCTTNDKRSTLGKVYVPLRPISDADLQ